MVVSMIFMCTESSPVTEDEAVISRTRRHVHHSPVITKSKDVCFKYWKAKPKLDANMTNIDKLKVNYIWSSKSICQS